MTSYDDLQRFKEKTQTNNIDFKDMSGQMFNAQSTPWPLIKQLLNEGAERVLDNSPRIDAPKMVDPGVFKAPDVSKKSPSPAGSPSRVAAAPDASDNRSVSLLDSIAALLPLAEAPFTVAQAVDAKAASLVAQANGGLLRPPSLSPSGALAKDTLLQPLLEKIASCR